MRVAVIGAGIGGLGTGVALRRSGFNDFTIFEKAPSIGGTWWYNKYPGAEVDSPSFIYTYSFLHYDWSRTHARQGEILRYLERVVDKFGLDDHIRCGTAVISARWSEADHKYTVTTEDGEQQVFDIVVSATGFLSEPKVPDWPGWDEFQGPKFHSARWEAHHELSDKRVALVGVGATAAQIAPELAKTVSHLHIFQREPGWVIPKGSRDFTADERVRYRLSRHFLRARLREFINFERRQHGASVFREGGGRNIALEKLARDYLDEVFADRPELKDALTPGYAYGGKRTVYNDFYYPCLLRDNVELVPRAVTAFTADAVRDEAAEEHKVDAVVAATGFRTTNYLANLKVFGRDGREIHDVWAGEPEAFLGMMMTGFPNFFMLYGPNTNGGTMVYQLERQADYVVACLRHLRRRHAASVEVRPWALRRYNAWIQHRLEGTIWQTASNYFKSDSGKIVTQWPEGALFYGALSRTLRYFPWQTRRPKPTAGAARRSNMAADRKAAAVSTAGTGEAK